MAGETGQATHEEICDGALRHYREVSKRAFHWCSTVEYAIKFYKEHGKSSAPVAVIDDVESLINFYEGEHVYFTDIRDGCCQKSDRYDPVVLVDEFVAALKKLLRSPSVLPLSAPVAPAVTEEMIGAIYAMRDYLEESDLPTDFDIPDDIWLRFSRAVDSLSRLDPCAPAVAPVDAMIPRILDWLGRHGAADKFIGYDIAELANILSRLHPCAHDPRTVEKERRHDGKVA